ncbi:MAG: hypothetical protein GY820_22955 [Gammaproteobacteria bacterium]|nr:hypothetical protein [Gammaproteobacteria bacterium]
MTLFRQINPFCAQGKHHCTATRLFIFTAVFSPRDFSQSTFHSTFQTRWALQPASRPRRNKHENASARCRRLRKSVDGEMSCDSGWSVGEKSFRETSSVKSRR